jgi:competence protein ComEC
MIVAGVHDDRGDGHVRAARVRVGVIVALVCAGFVIARGLWGAGVGVPSWWWFCACVGAVAACAVARGRWAWVVRGAGSVAVVCFAAGVFTARAVEVSPSRVDRVVAEPGIVTLEGRVGDSPRATRAPATVLGAFGHREASTTFALRVRAVRGDGEWTRASGAVQVFVRGGTPAGVRAGDVVRVTGEFRPQGGSGNPYDEDWALWAAQASRAGTLDATGEALIEPGEAGVWDRTLAVVLRVRAALRLRAESVVARASGDADPGRRALFEGLMLGRTGVGVEAGEVSGVFTRLGLLHVLSISGFHLTVMAALALWVLRLTGDRGWLEPIMLCVIVLAYMAIVPASSPIVRSVAMVVSLLVVEATGRRYDRVCVLGWIAVALLLWRPMDLWSLGFQLSLGLTALLLSAGESFTEGVFTPALKGLVDDATLADRVRSGLRGAFAAGLMCWVVSLPVLMHATGLVSPAAVLATLVVSPIIIALLWVGYGALLAGVVLPSAGGLAAGVVSWLGGLALWASRWMDGLPLSSVRVPVVPTWWAVLATAVAVVWAHTLSWGRWRWLGVWTVVVGLLAAVWVTTPMTRSGVLRVDTLNVGDGTCMIVRSGDDAVLWDCKAARGGLGSMSGVASAARALGVWRVRRAVVTHPDLDHFSGLPEVVEPLGIEEVLVSRRFMGAVDGGGAPAALVAWLREKGVRITVVGAGDEVRVGRARARFIWPTKDAGGDSDNDYSLVAVLEQGAARMLLTGDVQERAIAALRAVDVGPIALMELPHHGQWSKESEAWLHGVSPRVVVQSTGERRAGDSRWDDTKRVVPAWHVTASGGWCGVEVREDGEVRVERAR